MADPTPSISLDALSALLQPGGAISRSISGYEARDVQQAMLADVVKAYNNNSIALIEAGTGTGKSMAYLLPAIAWAAKHKERTVISTGTINLQEQLIHKDIPTLTKALGIDVKAVLVKGMGNYVCKRKLEDAEEELNLLPTEEMRELRALGDWAGRAQDGSRSELPFIPAGSTWEKVRAESDSCTNQRCPHYKECFFFKARKEAEDAQILVSNHHLLFADLAMRGDLDNKGQGGVLPDYKRVILDEAHHIEAIATEYFADRVSRIDLIRLLAQLSSERGAKEASAEGSSAATQGKLHGLRDRLEDIYGKTPSDHTIASIHKRLVVDLPGNRTELLALISDLYNAVYQYLQLIEGGGNADASPRKESKLRLLPHHLTHPYWQSDVQVTAKSLIAAGDSYVTSVVNLLEDISNIDDVKMLERTQGIRAEVHAFAGRISDALRAIQGILIDAHDAQRVRWIESHQLKLITNIHLINAALDVSKSLANLLFSKFPSTVLCSATLTTNRQFGFFRQRLGLTEGLLPDKTITESIYESPFDYNGQALLVVPDDMPAPNSRDFLDHAVEKIWQCIKASRGNAFILFTSYSMLREAYDRLEEKLLRHRFIAMKQGDDSRQRLLERFRTTEYSVLFGTASFWEGVDVAGEALRCVVIVKLPFQVPSEPIVEARSEAITERGGNPFMEYSVPNAIVKFKQGFGRLIRNKRDRGCIVCLDSRLLTKRYGQLFLNSLPACPRITDATKMVDEMDTFYRRTYKRTKQMEESTVVTSTAR